MMRLSQMRGTLRGMIPGDGLSPSALLTAVHGLRATGSHSLLAGLAWCLCIGSAVAAPYAAEGKSTAWVQPNGTHLALRVLGDEFYARTVTADGHTVVFNAADQTYYYAAPGPDDQALVSSGIAAEQAPPAWLPPHLAEPAASVAAQRRENIRQIAPHRAADWAAEVAAVQDRQNRRDRQRTPAPASPPVLTPAAGPLLVDTKVGLVILVQFPDDSNTLAVDPVAFPTTQDKINRLCNQIGYTDDGNIGSIRDYYTDQSNSQMVLTQVVTPILTLPHPRNYYSYSDYPANTVLYNNGSTGNLIAGDAVSLLKALNFDFSSLSLDSFNDIVATSLLFAGADSGVWSKGLWPFSGSVPTAINVGTSQAPRYILNYQMTNIADAAPGIGTTAHELGHMLKKYPDLYDIDASNGASAGVGTHSLMSTGASLNHEKAPAPIDIYLKAFSGWATLTDLTPTQVLSAALPSTGNIGYRIRKPGKATEYFMIENRGTGDRWSAYCPDKGIMIWHVDETVTTQNGCQQMTPTQHYLCSLVQADGRSDMEHNVNTGDNTDLFKTTKGIFNNTTTPNANWWDASASGISIIVPSAPAASMTVNFGATPPTMALSPTSQSMLAAGGTLSFQVTSNTTWTWTSDSAWVTSAASGTQTGTQTISLTVAANATIVPRTAGITINVPGGLTATLTITQGGLLQPDLMVTSGSPSECGPAVVKPGGTVYVNSYVSNQGTVPSGTYAVNFYLSLDTTITTSDYLIGQKSQASLAVGSSELLAMSSLTVPLTTPGGTYHAGWIYDPTNAIVELNESNNTGYVTASTIIVDATNPTVAISSPATDGSTVTSPTLTVSGTAADNISVAQVYIAVNGGSSILLSGTTSWTGSVSLVPGLNTIGALTTDTAGNSSGWIYRTVTYAPTDATKPTVAITSPASNGTYVNNASLTVGGTATKGTYDLNVVYCLLNSTLPWLQASGTASWSRSVTLIPGLNNIKAIAYDNQSVYSAQVTRTITYDATPPTVAITSPASDGGTVNVTSLAIAGTAADDQNLTAVYWRNNGGAWNTANGTTAWSASVTLAAGSNTIEVQSKDAANNFSTVVSRSVTRISNRSTLSDLSLSLGTLSPAFTATTSSYTASVTNATTSITVTPTLTDATATIKVNGTTVASGTASGPIALSVGTNVITTVATAQDGTTTSTYTVTVTRALPGPVVSNISAVQRAGTQWVDITYNVSADTPTVQVTLAISSDGGTTFSVPATTVSGAVGSGVATGTGKVITWNAGADWSNQYSTTTRFKVTVDDLVAPAPAGLSLIPAGSFQMGDALDGLSDAPIRTVTVSAFYMAQNLVTWADWGTVRTWGLTHGYTDLAVGAGKAATHPVQTITWYDMVKWCNARSEKDGLTPCYTVSAVVYRTGSSDVAVCNWAANGYRLPSEAEWEKAARGGLSGKRFPWGDTISQSQANYYGGTSSYSYYDLGPNGYNSIGSIGGTDPATSPVGSFAANGYGLYDMAGNVFEWCWDWYGTYAAGAQTDPRGVASGWGRVYRGGIWCSYAVFCRAAFRDYYGPANSNYGLGFRVARSSVP